MYRVVCESYDTFTRDTSGYRREVFDFLRLIKDIDEYNRSKAEETTDYKRLSDFLHHIGDCRKCRQILDDLEGVGIEGREYGITTADDLDEQHKIMHMFLNLAYWR